MRHRKHKLCPVVQHISRTSYFGALPAQYTTPGWSSSPSAPRLLSRTPGPRRQRKLSGKAGIAPRHGVGPRTSCGQEEIHETIVVRSFGWCAAFHHRTRLLFRAAPRATQSCSRNGSAPAHRQRRSVPPLRATATPLSPCFPSPSSSVTLC